jgi:hypothetical protein
MIVPERRVLLWAELEADQFPEKLNGDQDTAFLGAHLERRGKRVIPLVRKDQDAAGSGQGDEDRPRGLRPLPIREAEILSCLHKSLDYAELTRRAALGAREAQLDSGRRPSPRSASFHVPGLHLAAGKPSPPSLRAHDDAEDHLRSASRRISSSRSCRTWRRLP